MTDPEFDAEILENEIVIAPAAEGHVFHFPLLSNGTVSLHGAEIEPNPQSRRQARRMLLDAHNAARAAFSASQVRP